MIARENWVQWIITVGLALIAGLGSAAAVRSSDMERIARLEAQAQFQQQMNLSIDVRLARMESKIDRLTERTSARTRE